jgi:glycine dehydrogenase subunit 1
MYDWATALGEAARMAVRVTKRNRVLVPRNIGPDRLAVLQTYCNPVDITVEKIDYDRRKGEVSIEQLHQLLNDDVAAVYIESPNYFGVIESNAPAIVEETKRRGAISIVGVEPISLGLLKPPGEYGADIVVGEGQPLGIPMNFGGPLLGIFASRDEPNLIRQMPGRIIGLTEEKRTGEKGYTMVLQTREQHIRREKATSNICTNEALAAVAAAVYLSLMGGDGLRELSYQIIFNSHFAANLISENKRIQTPYFDAPFFMDFTLSYRDQIQPVRIFRELHKRKILGCLPLAEHFPELSSLALLTVTEIHTHEDIERLASALKEVTG